MWKVQKCMWESENDEIVIWRLVIFISTQFSKKHGKIIS